MLNQFLCSAAIQRSLFEKVQTFGHSGTKAEPKGCFMGNYEYINEERNICIFLMITNPFILMYDNILMFSPDES